VLVGEGASYGQFEYPWCAESGGSRKRLLYCSSTDGALQSDRYRAPTVWIDTVISDNGYCYKRYVGSELS
jgi:hypothetical protein